MADLIKLAGDFILAYDRKNWDELRTLVVDSVCYDEKATERCVEGWGGLLEALQGWAKSFPDSIAQVTTACQSGNLVVLELCWKGTHKAPLVMPPGASPKTLPASNRTVEVPAAMVFAFVGDRIQTLRHYFNWPTLLRQIGA